MDEEIDLRKDIMTRIGDISNSYSYQARHQKIRKTRTRDLIFKSNYRNVYFDFNKDRIFIVGMSGSGKSWAAGTLMHYARKNKFPCIVIDWKGEYPKFGGGGSYTKYTPAYAHKPNTKIINFNVNSLSQLNWVNLLDLKSPSQRLMFGAIYNKCKRPLTIKRFRDAIKQADGSNLSKEVIELKLNEVVELGLITDDKGITYEILADRNRTIIIDVSWNDREERIYQIIVGILINILISYRLKKGEDAFEDDPLFFIIDEADKFIGKTYSACKLEVLALFSKGRSFNLNGVLVTQAPSYVNPIARDQCNIMLCGRIKNQNHIDAIKGASGVAFPYELKDEIPNFEDGEFLYVNERQAFRGKVMPPRSPRTVKEGIYESWR